MHRYLQNTISNLQTSISPWSRSRWATLFRAFFLGMVYIFILQKIVSQRGRLQPFLYICSNFGQILCTNVIKKNSVQNMGHNQLKKCSKYHFVSLLDEKQRSTFDIFCTLFNPLTTLTNSALGQFWEMLSHLETSYIATCYLLLVGY